MSPLLSKKDILILCVLCVSACLLIDSSRAFAIVVDPSTSQIEEALEKGRMAARDRVPPTQFYYAFGTVENLTPHGFLMTKLSGLSVMSAHFALRESKPSHEEIQRILEEDHLQVSVTIFGSSPNFAMNSYMTLEQGDRLIKPVRVRFDARASRTSGWPNSPSYRAKVVASFPYSSFDSDSVTTLTVFPGKGGETSFELDFRTIP